MRLAKKHRANGLYIPAIQIYQKLLRDYPDDTEARWGLMELVVTYKEASIDSVFPALQQLLGDHSNSHVKRVAADLLAAEYQKAGNLSAAINTAEQTIDNYPGTESEKAALFDLFNIHLFDLKRYSRAQGYLALLERNYPNDELTRHAQILLKDNRASLNPLTKQSSDAEPAEVKPQQFALQQNYPNPFNPETIIEYHLPTAAQVTLEIYNILGQKMVTLVNANLEAGIYQTTWTARDNEGNAVPSGMYIYRISATGNSAEQPGKFVEQKKMILMR